MTLEKLAQEYGNVLTHWNTMPPELKIPAIVAVSDCAHAMRTTTAHVRHMAKELHYESLQITDHGNAGC